MACTTVAMCANSMAGGVTAGWRRRTGLAGLTLALGCGAAWAEEATPRIGTISLYGAQGVNHNLRELPGKALAGGLEWEGSYFSALSLTGSVGSQQDRPAFLRSGPFERLKFSYELVLARHHGLQSVIETGAAGRVDSAPLWLGALGVHAGFGIGLSHMSGRPTYEDGPRGTPDRRYKNQLLLLFDLDWQWHDWPALSAFTRVHHRSGAYGLIAPSNVGSNFVGAGLRYRF
jgi:hypothetical protein